MTKKILVVDDEHEVVEVIKAILRTKDYNIHVAYDGEEGLQQLLQLRPDLVITDLRMPKMSGMEFVKRVRANPEVASTPVLVISSMTAGMDKPDAYWAAGLKSDDFLAKPFDPLSLLGRVEYLLRKSEYVSEGAAPQAGGTGFAHNQSQPASASTWEDIDPSEVVRHFIESWNDKDFMREYQALGDEMLFGLSAQEYVTRRMQLYQDEKGDETRHHMLDADSTIRHNVATVVCLREDQVKGIPRRKEEHYTLKKTQQGWKIINVRSKPLAFTIES